MGRDELGEGCKFRFFFLGISIEGDRDIWIWGVSSSVTSKFECGFRVFFFIWSSIKGSPTTLIWGSFFIKDAKSTLDGCQSFEDVVFFFWVSKSPL